MEYRLEQRSTVQIHNAVRSAECADYVPANSLQLVRILIVEHCGRASKQGRVEYHHTSTVRQLRSVRVVELIRQRYRRHFACHIDLHRSLPNRFTIHFGREDADNLVLDNIDLDNDIPGDGAGHGELECKQQC